MAENTENVVRAEKAKKPSWFKGLKAEFKKIVWPDKKKLAKQTVAVIVCSLVLGVIISIVDVILQYVIKLFV